MDCSLSSLIEASKCYRCIPGPVMQASAISLLCQWANNLTPPSCVISWAPATAVADWVDSAGPHSGNLAAFLATPTHLSTTSLELDSQGLTSLTCPQYLPDLTSLYVRQNNLTTIDVGNMPNLASFSADDNPALASIVTDGTPFSNLLSLENTGAITLDLSGNTEFGSDLITSGLGISGSGITSLNLSGCTGCHVITATATPLVSLALQGLTSLVQLLCDNSGNLTTINCTGCLDLTSIDCNGCASLTTLTLTGCTALTYLNCSLCALTGLNVDDCTLLDDLWFTDNPFGTNHTVDLSNCTVLNNVHGENCPGLWVVDMTNIGSMTGFIHFNNCVNLTTLTVPDVSDVNEDIRFIGCSNLGSISFPSLTHIGGEIDFDNSGVVTVNIPLVFTIGDVSSGRIDGSGCTSLVTFNAPTLNDVAGGGDIEFDGCTSLTTFIVTNMNSCGPITFDGCTSLLSLSFPALITVSGNFKSVGATNLASLSAPNWFISNGATIDCSGDALNVASIDAILSQGVSSGLTTSTITLTGGTNSPPTLSCANPLSDCFALNAAGCTVTTN